MLKNSKLQSEFAQPISFSKDNKGEVKHKVKPFPDSQGQKGACCLSEVKSSTKSQQQKTSQSLDCGISKCSSTFDNQQ